MKKLALGSLLTLGLLLPTAVTANTWFVGADHLWHHLEVSSTRFKPTSVRLHAGFWMLEGIGLEFRGTQSLSSYTKHNLEFEITDSSSLALRFQSPRDLDVSAYILVGGTQFNLDGNSNGSTFPGTERFQGGYAAIGLLRFLGQTNAALALEYERHFVDEDEQLEPAAWSLGLHYEF